jgi:signal transduction histidine kinase/ligand-binding sensor domain-containing protein
VRFDGSRFVVFDRSIDGIGSQRIRTMLEDSRGTLWAATDDGMLIRYRDGLFTTYTSKHGLPHAVALRIDEDAERNLWITWTDRITKHDGTTFVTYRRGDFPHDVANRHPSPGMQSRHHDLWWSRDAAGLHCFYKGRVDTCAAEDKLPRQEIVSVGVDDHDNIWVSTKGGGVHRIRAGQLRSYSTRDGLPSDDADGRFFEDRHGTLWFAPRGGGLYRIRDAQQELLSPIGVSAIYQDHEDSIWVGSPLGLYRVREPTFIMHGENDGLSSNLVYSILQDRRGNVWIGTWGGGVNSYVQGRFTSYGEAQGLPSSHVTCLYEDKSGQLWVGTLSGLAQFANGRFRRYADPEGYLGGAVWAIHEDRRGVLWFATDNGLVRVQDQQVTRYNSTNGLSHHHVTAFAEGRSGALWIGTFQGLTRLEDGVFTTYTERDGVIGNQVRAIYEDADEVLWIGTYDGGLYRMKQGRLTRYTTKNGLHDNGVFQILEDDTGHLWMGSNRGIYRVSRRELNDFAEGAARSIRPTAFGTRDGLSTLECNGGRQPSGLKTADGKLWFPTMGGVAIVDPRAVRANIQPPPVVIEEILVRGEQVGLRGDVTMPHDVNSVEIRYTAASFVSPEQLRFRHRLVGLDDNWTDAGERRTATYDRIPPGRYRFAVSAAIGEGAWSAQVQTVNFVILAPFWRQQWFMGLVILTVVLAGIALDRRRVRGHRREQSRQTAFAQRLIEAQEGERKRISTELHDSLGQDLFVIKAQIRSARGVVPNAEQILHALNAIDDVASRASEGLKEVAHALRPYQLDKIGLSATIAGMVRRVGDVCGMDVTIEIDDVDERLEAARQINTYRIVQECISNIVKHAHATRARVTLKAGVRSIEIRVEDNGRGFLHERVESRNGSAGGLGLMAIRERARGLGGEASVHSVIGEGTTVVVRFPLDGRGHAR